MSKPKIMHALLVEPEGRLVPGNEYATLCDITWTYEPLLPEEVRTRFVCAMCHHEQITELLAAVTDLQNAYNRHLELYHPTHDRNDHTPQGEAHEQH